MALRVLDKDDENDDPPDTSACPHCRTLLGNFADDIEIVDDVSGKNADCPACKKPIVLIAEITYRIAKKKQT